MSDDHYRFDREKIAAGIASWAAVESPSYDAVAVNKMMDLAVAETSALGAEITRFPGSDGYGDAVRAHLPWGEGPGVLVLGHLDTVHLVGTLAETLAVKREGDKLFGPGVLDMKGGMYLAVHALSKVLSVRERLNIPVTFLFIPDEEVGSPSTRVLIEEEAKAHKYVLVPEPGKDEKFVTGRHGFLRYKLHVYGKPAHAGVAVGVGRSSISVMARLITEIEDYSDVDREITYRVGNVQGGTFVNVIPTDEAFGIIQERMAAISSPDPEVQVEVEAGPIRPLFQAHEGTMELLDVAQRIARDIGLELGHGQFGGGSDGNFTGALGIPTLDGLGVCGDGVHTKHEHLLVSSLEPRARLLAGLFEALSDRNR